MKEYRTRMLCETISHGWRRGSPSYASAGAGIELARQASSRVPLALSGATPAQDRTHGPPIAASPSSTRRARPARQSIASECQSGSPPAKALSEAGLPGDRDACPGNGECHQDGDGEGLSAESERPPRLPNHGARGSVGRSHEDRIVRQQVGLAGRTDRRFRFRVPNSRKAPRRVVIERTSPSPESRYSRSVRTVAASTPPSSAGRNRMPPPAASIRATQRSLPCGSYT